jgi:hypothetical protein
VISYTLLPLNLLLTFENNAIDKLVTLVYVRFTLDKYRHRQCSSYSFDDYRHPSDFKMLKFDFIYLLIY